MKDELNELFKTYATKAKQLDFKDFKKCIR